MSLKKRVAVCISSESRTWDSCITNIKNFFKNSDEYTFDYFIHTWDISTYQRLYSCKVKTNPLEYHYIKYKSNPRDYVEAYNPTLFKIEKFDDFLQRKKLKNKLTTDNNNFNLMYSFKQSIVLKRLWERKFNFEYDYVVKIRPDIVFINQKFEEHIKLLNLNIDKQNPFICYFDFEEEWDTNLISNWGPDLYWVFNNTQNSNKYSEYFSKGIAFEKINKTYYSHNRLCVENNFNPISITTDTKNFPIHIIRPFHLPFINLNNDIDDKVIHKISNFFVPPWDASISFIDLLINENKKINLETYDIVSFFKANRDIKNKVLSIINDIYKKQ